MKIVGTSTVSIFGKDVRCELTESEPDDVWFYMTMGGGLHGGRMLPGDPQKEVFVSQMMQQGFTVRQYCEAMGRSVPTPPLDKGYDKLISDVLRLPNGNPKTSSS